MEPSLDAVRAAGAAIETFIRPATFPLAVKIIKEDKAIPPDFKRPRQMFGFQNFVCQNFKMARTYGWSLAVTEQDINCYLARNIYGWDPATEETISAAHQFNIGLYAKDMEASKKLEAHLFRLPEKFSGLTISPLTRARMVPDVALIYCLPAQAMRLIQSYLFFQGGALTFGSTGRIGSCHEGVIKTMVTGKPQLVLLGNGDRVWGGAQDSEVLFSCPAGDLEMLADGLKQTHEAGLRYPVPAYMNYSPGFQAEFEKKALDRAGRTIVRPTP
ncbi:MAG: DUF169 domain-containing protein [Thermodesulfobacteriota bacterium]